MQSNLVQISNIFNLMVQADSRLEFYHFGWRSDINRNIDNNFDQGTITGRKFPAVQFHVPENISHSQDGLSYLGNKEEIQITLYFDDLQDYNNDSSGKTDTLIEQWTNLKQIAEDFVLNFNVLLCDKYGIGYIDSEVKYIPRSNLHNDKLITWEVSFMLVHTTPCTLEENIIDINLFPNSIQEIDFENYIAIQNSIKKSLLFDGVNEYIETSDYLPYDFESNEPFSVEFWFYPLTIQTAFLARHDSLVGGVGKGWRVLILSNGNVQFTIGEGDFFSRRVVVNAGPYNVNQWNHVIITKDSTRFAAGVNIYIDGELKPPIIQEDGLTGLSIKNNNIVSFFGSANNSFNGNGLVTRIWNTELNFSQVTDLFDSVCADGGGGTNNPITTNNILDLQLGEAVFNVDKFEIQDYSGTVVNAFSTNMEEEDLVEESPCNL